jgi:NTE family protein
VNGFVLSGAANLGSIQAGMLKALLKAGITPDVFVGTSIGAVNAAFLAADPTLDQAEALCELWSEARAREIFPPNPWVIGRALFRQGSLFPSDPWRRFLEGRLPYERIEEASVQLRITATDFEDGKPVVLDSGPVVEAILASTALPCVFPPHQIGDRLYLDGALSDQVPLKPAIEAGADTVYVMAVNVPRPPPDRRSPGSILRHSFTILLFPRIRLDALDLPARHPDLRIVQVPSVSTQVSLWDMSRHGELIERAYDEVTRFLAERESEHQEQEPRAHVASVPETEVEAELQQATGPENRSADGAQSDA